MVDSVRQNRKRIPEKTKLVKNDELYTSRFSISAPKNIMMCSYKVKET